MASAPAALACSAKWIDSSVRMAPVPTISGRRPLITALASPINSIRSSADWA